MRIADKMQYNQVNQNVTKNRTEMSELQNQAATQKRLTKPSDDPLASARVLSARTEERGNQQYIKNINNVKSFLEFTDQSLGELSEILMRAKELAIGQANDASGNEQSRQVSASEIEQIYNQSVQIGNRKLGDRFIFGGSQTQTAPFDQQGQYAGNDSDMKIGIHKDTFVSMNIPGNKVFLGKGLSGDGIVRSRSETPTSVKSLQDFKQEEIQRREENQDREANFVETRAPASSYRAQRVGAIAKDPVTNSGGVNLFQTLKGLEISLRANDKQGIQETLDTLDQVISQVVQARSEVGARVMAVTNTTESLQKAIVDNKVMASQLEDVELFDVVSSINKTDSTLRATLETSGKLIQQSLMDFLK
ncbi:MAG TPA: flagellar hook-associated protein FlgL [Pseudobdellovibrionaceae bacterium]|jgi:flagellar hook-associated protein 3 FlgL